VLPYLLYLLSPYLLLYAYAYDMVSMHALGLEFIDTRVFVSARHLVFTTPLIGEF